MQLSHILRPTFKVGSYMFINQDASTISRGDAMQLLKEHLPAFLKFWSSLEHVTGFRWKCTSLIRDSISHHVGQAMDLAPDFSLKGAPQYSGNRDSDPVLYKREGLIRDLQQLTTTKFTVRPDTYLGIYIESDHLHIQIMKRDPGMAEGPIVNRILKWGKMKPVYSDTEARSKLPLLK